MAKSLNEIKKLKPAEVDGIVSALLSDTQSISKDAGVKLAHDANAYGISIKDYCILSIDKEQGKDGLNGFEQMLMKLNLPLFDDYENGILLQAASDTFQTKPGTRALFPEVIDEVLRYASRQEQIENVAALIASTRTINGNEMLSRVIDDDLSDGENDSFQVPELGRVPVRTIKMSEQSVKIWKHGSGIRTSYEFQRRSSIDLIKPHAARIARELERSKVLAATQILINGDGVNPAATSVNQSSFNTPTGFTATSGKINWQHFLYWLVQRAKAGVPVDTVLMNWDGIFQWMMLFGANQTIGAGGFGPTASENLQKAGVDVATAGQVISLLSRIQPVLSSNMPANQLLGFTKGDTIEELKEAGSDIQETERAIQNQSITLIKTENSGYKLVYPDTRQIFVYNA